MKNEISFESMKIQPYTAKLFQNLDKSEKVGVWTGTPGVLKV